MSLKLKIQENSISIAKKFDHGQILPEHVLLALLQTVNSAEQDDSQQAALETQLIERLSKFKDIPKSTGTIEITDKAKNIFERCTSEENSNQCKRELVKELFDLEISTPEAPQRKVESPESEVQADPISLEQALSDLDSLIGLEQVKTDVRKLIAVHQANQVRIDAGLPAVPQSLHLVFTGSPGTGKTTVSRCVANIYRAIGLLPSNGLVEVGRADLVAGYVGQTAIKVQEVIKSAIGGVLFIDEAYALATDSSYGYGAEAIAELVKSMENHRHELAVIAAGYKEDMNLFVSSNPGLKSRFQNFVHFPDYSGTELLQIFSDLAASNQVNISTELRDHLLAYLSQNTPKGEMGNARFVRNLFESMFKNMSARAAADGVIEIEEITELQIADLPPLTSFSGESTLGFHR